MSMTRGNPGALFNSTQYGFSQAVSAKGSRIVMTSGQVAWDADETLTGAGDLYAEASKSLENVKIALSSLDARLADVVSLRIYIVDYKLEESDLISRALKESFPEGEEPAATWIGVNCLANPDFRIEIEAMAVVPEA
ncbi:RidA family protein [Denitrobaculum tricleocarpae]|nr:RidA family protein [Denitrobaculum tricleocarpae]